MKLCDRCGTDNTDNSRYCKGCGYELPQTTVQLEVHPADAKSAKKVNYKAIIGALIGVVVAALLTQGISFAGGYFMKTTPVVDKMMVKTADEMNKALPMMVDQVTRLDNAAALPGKVFQYSYTIIGIDRELVDTTAFKQNMEPQMINRIKTNPDMKFIRDNEATLRFNYNDESGTYWFRIEIKPKQYKE